MANINNDYAAIADTLYNKWKENGASTYDIEVMKNRFYGNMVRDHVDVFMEMYNILEGHGPKNPIVTGDYDEGSWIEKSPTEFSKVIAITRYCSTADDNTHIFMLRDFKILDDDEWVDFSCFTAWPRQVRNRNGSNWGDHRDILRPSIHTHREHNFRFGYEDGRDKHYSFNYSSTQGNVADASWNEGRIIRALSSLTDALEQIKIEAEENA